MSKEIDWVDMGNGFIARHEGRFLAEPVDTGREYVRDFKSMQRAMRYIDAVAEVRRHGLRVSLEPERKL